MAANTIIIYAHYGSKHLVVSHILQTSQGTPLGVKGWLPTNWPKRKDDYVCKRSISHWRIRRLGLGHVRFLKMSSPAQQIPQNHGVQGHTFANRIVQARLRISEFKLGGTLASGGSRI
jgi:hypothetical protein